MKQLKCLLILFGAIGGCIWIFTWQQRAEWSVECPQNTSLVGFTSDDGSVWLVDERTDPSRVRVHFYSVADGTVQRNLDLPVRPGRILLNEVYEDQPGRLIVSTRPNKNAFKQGVEEHECFDLANGQRLCPPVADPSRHRINVTISPTAKYAVVGNGERGLSVTGTRSGDELFTVERVPTEIEDVVLTPAQAMINNTEDKLLVVLVPMNGSIYLDDQRILRLYELPEGRLLYDKQIPLGTYRVRAWKDDEIEMDSVMPVAGRRITFSIADNSAFQAHRFDLTSEELVGTPIPHRVGYYSDRFGWECVNYAAEADTPWLFYTRSWRKAKPKWVSWVRQYEPRFLGFGWYNTDRHESWLADPTTGKTIWHVPKGPDTGKVSADGEMFARTTWEYGASNNRLELYSTQPWPRWPGMVLIVAVASWLIRRSWTKKTAA